MINTGPFSCVYQEKNVWWNLSENKKVAEILPFWSMEGIFKFMQIQTIKFLDWNLLEIHENKEEKSDLVECQREAFEDRKVRPGLKM